MRAPACESPVYARGHCVRHHKQVLRTGAILQDRGEKVCAVPTCERAPVSRGWYHGQALCEAHYQRMLTSGDVREGEPFRAVSGDGFVHYGYRNVPVEAADR